jgi:hypothetical protein
MGMMFLERTPGPNTALYNGVGVSTYQCEMKMIYNMYRYRVVRLLSKGLLAYAI